MQISVHNYFPTQILIQLITIERRQVFRSHNGVLGVSKGWQLAGAHCDHIVLLSISVPNPQVTRPAQDNPLSPANLLQLNHFLSTFAVTLNTSEHSNWQKCCGVRNMDVNYLHYIIQKYVKSDLPNYK